MDGGLHAVVETAQPESEVVAGLAAQGISVCPLSQYWGGSASRQGIVFGFGVASEVELAHALALIRAQVQCSRPSEGSRPTTHP